MIQMQNLVEENTKLKEQERESQDAINELQAKVKTLEEQIFEADAVINDKSKVIDTLKGAHLRLRRKLKSFNEMEKTLKDKETENVRLNAQMEAMEKTNRELLNRLEQVHKKKFGYAPKKSNYNNFEAGSGRGHPIISSTAIGETATARSSTTCTNASPTTAYATAAAHSAKPTTEL